MSCEKYIAISVLYSVITPHVVFYVNKKRLCVQMCDSEKEFTKTSDVFVVSAGNRGTMAGASTFPEVRLFWTSGTRSQTTRTSWSRTAPHWVRESFQHTLWLIKDFKIKATFADGTTSLLDLSKRKTFATICLFLSAAGMDLDFK